MQINDIVSSVNATPVNSFSLTDLSISVNKVQSTVFVLNCSDLLLFVPTFALRSFRLAIG